jgi:signal transduction histidine kinase
MRITTKLALKNLLAIAIVITMGGMLVATTRTVNVALQNADIASRIADGTATLRYLALEYLGSPSERAEMQWRQKHKSLLELIDKVGAGDVLEKRQLESLRLQILLLKEGYEKLLGNIPKTPAASRPRGDASNEYASKLASSLIVNTQSVIGHAATLENQSRARVESLLDRAQWVFLLIGVGLSIMLLTVMTAVTRDITRRLGRLRQGAEAIGLAQLGYRIYMPSDDEIGAVEKSFNNMADQLQSQRQALVSESTRRGEAEQSLIQAVSAAEVANKELETFAYSVSHDLRAPIRGMAGFSQILIEDFGAQLPQEAQEHLRVIQAEGQRMGQLIDDLLNLSRVARAPLRREAVDMSALATEVLATLRKAEPARKVECIVADGLTASGDPGLLKILLNNLLGNAWKFTGRTAAPRIEFGAASGNGGPAFVVRDNGAGFDMAYSGKLFGAFQRLHTSDEFPGTGIGLAIVQRILNRHGGRIWAEGATNQGATFSFSL